MTYTVLLNLLFSTSSSLWIYVSLLYHLLSLLQCPRPLWQAFHLRVMRLPSFCVQYFSLYFFPAFNFSSLKYFLLMRRSPTKCLIYSPPCWHFLLYFFSVAFINTLTLFTVLFVVCLSTSIPTRFLSALLTTIPLPLKTVPCKLKMLSKHLKWNQWKMLRFSLDLPPFMFFVLTMWGGIQTVYSRPWRQRKLGKDWLKYLPMLGHGQESYPFEPQATQWN